MSRMAAKEVEAFFERQRQHRNREREALVMIERAVLGKDVGMFVDAIDPIEMLCLWPQAMRRIAKLPPPDPEMQEWFAGLWHRSGDHLRQETLDDRILVRAP